MSQFNVPTPGSQLAELPDPMPDGFYWFKDARYPDEDVVVVNIYGVEEIHPKRQRVAFAGLGKDRWLDQTPGLYIGPIDVPEALQ